MNEIINAIGNSEYDFIGPLTFSTIMLIGILIGFWNGFRTTVYFLVLNIFCITSIILIFNFGAELSKKIISGGLSYETQDASKSILELAKAGNKGVSNVVSLLGSLVSVIGLNLLFFLPLYLVFRKTLKTTMFENKIAKISNLKHRLGGAAIGLIIAFPVAVLAAALATSFGSEGSGFVSFISNVSEIVVAGQAINIPESIYDLARILKN